MCVVSCSLCVALLAVVVVRGSLFVVYVFVVCRLLCSLFVVRCLLGVVLVFFYNCLLRVVCCSNVCCLFVFLGWLFVVRCSLFVFECWLLVVRWPLNVLFLCCVLFVVCCLLLVVCGCWRLLFLVGWSMFGACLFYWGLWCWLFVVCCFAVCYLLFVVLALRLWLFFVVCRLCVVC